MKLPPRAALLLVLLGCSNLTGDNGVVALELRLPSPAIVERNDTLLLRARALNLSGDSVAAAIVWRTPDTTLVLDSTGRVTSTLTSGTGRVQAITGSLRSDLVTLTIRRRSDTLSLTGATADTVPATDSASAALLAAVRSLAPDTVGILNTTILYEVVDSATVQGKLHFAGGALAIRATTGVDGAPAVPVTLRKAPGTTPPGQAQVRVSARRPSGVAVPGSGQVFTVVFQ